MKIKKKCKFEIDELDIYLRKVHTYYLEASKHEKIHLLLVRFHVKPDSF